MILRFLLRVRARVAIGLLAAVLPWLITLPSLRADEAPDPSLNEKILSLPGDPARPVMLQVTLFTPDGPGPFPLAVINHGKEVGEPKNQARYRSPYLSQYFLSRGYAVAMPMMRGFAGSGGVFDPHGADVGAAGRIAAKDIAAVIGDLAQRPEIDGSRIIVAGQSFGGWNTLAFAEMNCPGVRGVLNFCGGWREPSISDWQDNLIQAAGAYGARTRLPSLWFYGDNDSVFPTATWHAMYNKYVEKGGPATLVAFGTFLSDSHNLLGSLEGFPLWMPKVDAFLAGLGLPGTLLTPRYLPAVPPPPSHFAAIDDIAAVPYLTEKDQAIYKKFLAAPLPRVFIIMPHLGSASFDGGYDPLTRGLEACRQKSPNCRVYAVDNQVVWVPDPAVTVTEDHPSEAGDKPAPAVKDSAEAAKFRDLAAKGDLEGERRLGYLYLIGYGVPVVPNESAKWIELAAAQGDPFSQGLQLQYGFGVSPDPAKALDTYRQAAAANDPLAMFQLGHLYFKGLNGAPDLGQAVNWFQKAADQGLAMAQMRIGLFYQNGQGEAQDYTQALAWFQKAADQGMDSSENQVGNFYIHGWGVPKDYGQALTYYHKAADQGFHTAEYNLGVMCQQGWGMPKDDDQARLWYQKAAAQGFIPAKEALLKIDSSSGANAGTNPEIGPQ